MSKAQLILIPTYLGSFDHSVDEKGRLNLPSRIRKTIAERNAYNIHSSNFEVTRDVNGDFVVSYMGIPFAALKPNNSTSKDSLDTSGLDRVIYIATGSIRDERPSFHCNGCDTIFVYSATDAQRMLYDKTWNNSDFSSNNRITKIEKGGRIKLIPFEETISVNVHALQPSIKPLEGRVKEKSTIITGHPSLYCATLTQGYQPTL